MTEKKTIVFTGGGTAGHVTPNLALIRKLDRAEWDIHSSGCPACFPKGNCS